MTMEYRVVNVNAPRFKFNPFKCFGEDEGAARYFLEHQDFGCSDLGDGHRLERRPIGGNPDDWEEVEFVSANRIGEIHAEDKRKREEAIRAASRR